MVTNDEIIRFFQDAPDDGSDESALRIGRAIRNAVLEEACAAIEAADNKYRKEYYMLDSDDCIWVVRALMTKEGEQS